MSERMLTLVGLGDIAVKRTVNGRLTAADALGHRDFVMTKLYRSA